MRGFETWGLRVKLQVPNFLYEVDMAKNRAVFLFALPVLFIAAVCVAFFVVPKYLGRKEGAISPANSEVITRFHLTEARQLGKIMIGQLGRPAEIEGFQCAAGFVHFYETGKLCAFSLAESTMIQGNQIPGGTWVKLNPDSALQACFFPGDTAIQGYTCKGSALGPEGSITGFYPNGRLSFFNPRNDVEVNGVLCRATPFGGVYLFESGSLKECTLARDELINGRSLSSGQVLVLDEEGQIQSVRSASWIERMRNWAAKLF